MKTPFDTVLRMRRREIDRTRIAIHMETTRLTEIDQQSRALEEELAREYEVCAQSWAASAEAFVRRRMSQQADLMAQRVMVSEQIGRLRREAIDAYGSQHVLENAAEAFRTDHRRQQSRAEQREADDLCAARAVPAPRAAAAPTVLQLPPR